MEQETQEKREAASEENIVQSWKDKLWEGIKLFVIPILIVLFVRIYIVQPFIVKGASMEPNFEDREYLIIDEITPVFRGLTRGTVIVFHYPLNPSEFFIKRVVGLPGETVVIKNGEIKIRNAEGNETILRESYLARGMVTIGDLEMKIPENNFFVLGDNRNFSSDSRRWGLLPKDQVTGKALLRLWPPEKIGFIGPAQY